MGHLRPGIRLPTTAAGTEKPMSWWRWEGEDLCLRLRVQPRAKQDAFLAPFGGLYRVQITAPPADDKANQHLQRFLAETFDVPVSRVRLVCGRRSRTKQVRVHAPRHLPAFVPGPQPEID